MKAGNRNTEALSKELFGYTTIHDTIILSKKRKFNIILQSLVYGPPRIVLCYLCAESKAIMTFTRLEYRGPSSHEAKSRAN
jgi:hypothetical protein